MSRLRDQYRKIKYCAYALVLVAAFVLENARGITFSFWGGSATALPFLVAAIALFEGPYVAGIFGFAAGIIASTHSPIIEGLTALYLGLFGIAFGVIGAAYMRRVLLSAMLGGTVCVLVQGMFRYIFYYGLIYGVPLLGGLRGIAAELLLSLAPGVAVYYLVRALYRRFSEEESL